MNEIINKFTKISNILGKIDAVDHRIDAVNETVIACKPYRVLISVEKQFLRR